MRIGGARVQTRTQQGERLIIRSPREHCHTSNETTRMASLHYGLQRHDLPTEDSLEQPDEGSEHEEENEDAEDQGETNPERTAHPNP